MKELDGQKFTDTKFPTNEESVGFLGQFVKSWERPPEDMTVYGSGFNTVDPRQGKIGDCYYVSALTVAGEKFIKGALFFDKKYNENKIGAYIARFYFQGEPVEVIIDDQFAKDNEGFSFVKSEDGKKLWPMILEKAYAKLYGGYHKIVAGKVSYALSELTGGLPEEKSLKAAQQNVDKFWEELKNYVKEGYLLGAGSPENPMGDAAVSDEGIVQGHAYAVLDVAEFNGEYLIKLKNPHGVGGQEWTGDWSDNSYKWNEKAKKALKITEHKDDGEFWMSVEDFAYEFKSLYVCRIFDPKIWFTIPDIEGAWVKGVSSAGLPMRSNPNVDMTKNPHFGLRVKKKCKAFIVLTQNQTINMFKGENNILFMVQRNNGRRVSSTSADLLVGMSGPPTNLISVSAEMTLDAPSFPYTFSLMVACATEGVEGSFKVDVHCTAEVEYVDI